MQNKQPIGKWEPKLLPSATEKDVKKTKAWFSDGQIENILFVITFSGVSPEWRD